MPKRTMNTARTLAARLWRDDAGASSAMMLVLLTAIVAMAAIVGLASVRDHVVQQFGDIAVALDNIDQSFSYEVQINAVTVNEAEYIDPAPTLTDGGGDAPACLMFTAPTPGEGPAAVPTGDFP